MNHDCSTWNAIRADIAHVQVQLQETWVEEREKHPNGWRDARGREP